LPHHSLALLTSANIASLGFFGQPDYGVHPGFQPDAPACQPPSLPLTHPWRGDDLSGDYDFVDSQHGWAVTNTRLLSTTDGGQSWQERLEWKLPDPVGMNHSLYGIDFHLCQEGFAFQDYKLIHTWMADLPG